MFIHITGASGSGTTTLSEALAAELGFVHLDADDYFWLPTPEPFTVRRDRTERLALLLADLRARLGMSMLYVTHDLGVLAQIADRVGVMYAGRMVEIAPAATLFAAPRHPYTRGLIASVPQIDAAGKSPGAVNVVTAGGAYTLVLVVASCLSMAFMGFAGLLSAS